MVWVIMKVWFWFIVAGHVWLVLTLHSAATRIHTNTNNDLTADM